MQADTGRTDPPSGLGHLPAIVLTSNAIKAGRDDVVIEVGAAAEDHDAALYLPPIAGIGMVKAKANSSKPAAADVLNRIAALIDAKRAA